MSRAGIVSTVREASAVAPTPEEALRLAVEEARGAIGGRHEIVDVTLARVKATWGAGKPTTYRWTCTVRAEREA